MNQSLNPNPDPLDDLRAYYDRLCKHDWYYDYSDDGKVWQRGLDSRNRLEVEARTDPKKAELYNGFKNHYFSGRAFGTERQPHPERP